MASVAVSNDPQHRAVEDDRDERSIIRVFVWDYTQRANPKLSILAVNTADGVHIPFAFFDLGLTLAVLQVE